MPFTADFRIIETDRLAAVVAAATIVTAVAVNIAYRRPLITYLVVSIFSYGIVTQLVRSILVFKIKFSVTAYFCSCLLYTSDAADD